MSVFRDVTGRRGTAVKLASVVGGIVALVAVGVFLVSVFPAPWTRPGEVAPEPAPAPRAGAPAPARHLESRAREADYRKEEQRLRALLAQAQAAQHRRRPASSGEPVLAAFVVNWDPASLRSLQAHADQITHVMPEWVRLQANGELLVEEDSRVLQAAQKLEVVPTVSNWSGDGFSRQVARAALATDASRREVARKLAALCEERGFAGINLDLEDLDNALWLQEAQLVEAAWKEMHPKGLLVTVDVPAEPASIPVERLAASSDFLVVMAYDEHAATDNPGPIATPESVARAAGEYLRRAPAGKIVLAVGAYGYDWPLDADGDAASPAEELSYAQALGLARENEVPIEWDGSARSPFFEYDDDDVSPSVKHAVRFLDAPSAAAQLERVRGLGLRGTAIWRLGAEDPKLFDLFGRAPAPRVFDETAARDRLEGSIPNAPDDVQLSGEGELITLQAAPQPGRRKVSWNPDGTVQRVDYQQYPSGWILERKGGRPGGRVALSFDDGPDPVWTPRILDFLQGRGVHAAFFLIGENAQARPDLVRREFAEGHVIGNHTFTHPDLSRVSPLRFEVELKVTEKLLEWITGREPKLLRPPYHSDESLDDPANAQVISRASGLGYLTLGQNIDPEDFSLTDPQEIARRTLALAKDGGVILLHDGGGNRAATLAALPLILDGLAQKGLRLVSPEEITGMSHDALLPPAPRAPVSALIEGADTVVFGVLSALARLLGPAFAFAIALLALRAVVLAVLAPLQERRARKRVVVPYRGTISVVVPAYNEEQVIARTVETLLAQEPPVLEVVCVDDGSKDRTLQVLQENFEHHPRVRIFGKPNGGKSSALNLGFGEARGEVVVALDSDTLFAPNTVARLTAPFADPSVGAVAGNAKVGNRVNRITRWQALEYVTAQNLERRAWDLARAVPVVPGAVGAWRRSAVADAGGFHEDTLAEDTDLTLRLIARGLHVVYAEDALAYTEAPQTTRALLKQRFRWTYGVLQACWKHKGRLFHKRGGVLGWVILPTFAVYQFLVPLVAPIVDILLVVSLLLGRGLATAGYYLLFFALDLALSAVAVLLEGEDLKLLLGLFVQRILYRQILWVALVRSLWTALAGFAVGWGKLARTGTAQVGTARRASP
jgi:cellulose synthase/poly-beta-1,6-N-acetylglucosamine synthase-like glycosyltransferase/peptidoglycan/xylan/chitin deacetylase (PgdA/CDA1 family)/spore germination protein YaaH